MSVNIFSRIIASTRRKTFQKILQRPYSIYEPDYLEALKPKYPLYPPLTVDIRGYDYPILESYQSWVHKIALIMDFDVEESYAVPAKDLRVVRFRPQSAIPEAEYLLHIYHRALRISNVSSVRLPIFIRVIEKALPVGVMLDIDEFSEEKDNKRYIPDTKLLELKDELEGIGKEK